MELVWVLLAVVVVVIILWMGCRDSEKYSPGIFSQPLAFGYYRYGYPYSYYGTWYRPQGYWGGWSRGNPYGYGGYGYGGKQQNLYCRSGCFSKYASHCKESSQKCAEELDHCMDLCEAHAPYYDYDHGY